MKQKQNQMQKAQKIVVMLYCMYIAVLIKDSNHLKEAVS
jgi:hypothetical protein